MARVQRIVSVLLVCFLPTVACADHVEDLRFRTNAVHGTTNNRPIKIRARLYLPARAKFPVAAVVIAPSSAGVSENTEIYYARQLQKAGIAAMVIYSYASRGLNGAMYDQSILESWDIENDAVAALRWLIADGRFKPNKIGILGVSNGGTAAMDTALQIRREWSGMTDISFDAHVAIAPDCTWVTRSAKTTGAPILFLLAGHDDQSPPQDCVKEAARIRRAGNTHVHLKMYERAQHSWEDLGEAPVFDPDAENYSACRVWIENDGSMVAAKTGKRVPETRWHAWAKRNCMTYGAHCCGGTPELKQEATSDIIAFLKRAGF